MDAILRYSKMEDNLETMLPNIESSKSTIMESITFKNGIIIYGLFADGFRLQCFSNIYPNNLHKYPFVKIIDVI